MKKWPLYILIAIVIIFSFIYYQNSLANFVWTKFRAPNIAILLDKSDVNLAMQIGNHYFGGGEYDLKKSERAYKKAVKINPKILWGHYQLARIYFVGGEYDKALEEIRREFEANQENLRSLYVRGLIYGNRDWKGDLEKAEGDFRSFINWAPKEWAGYNDLAWILSKQGKNLEAEKTIFSALKEVHDAEINPWLWNSLGVAELNLKKYKEATLSFKKAKDLAEKITLKEWRSAYPGNNPNTYDNGISNFLRAIDKNLETAIIFTE